MVARAAQGASAADVGRRTPLQTTPRSGMLHLALARLTALMLVQVCLVSAHEALPYYVYSVIENAMSQLGNEAQGAAQSQQANI